MQGRAGGSFRRFVGLVAVMIVLLAACVGGVLLVRGGDRPPASARATADVVGGRLQLRIPTDRGLEVGVVGDSIAHGYYASEQRRAWPGVLKTALERYGRVSEEVDAASGETTGEALGRAVPAGDDLVVVELGTNDVVRRTGSSFATAYQELLLRLARASPRAVLLCLEPWGPQARVAAYSATIDRLCRAAGGKAAAISGIYSLGANRANAGIPFFGGTSRDDFHPDDRGHAAIAHLLVSMIHVSP